MAEHFALVVFGLLVGVAIGLLVGYVVAAVRRRVENPLVEITISLFTGYAAYLPAEELGIIGIPASGILAAATTKITRHARLTSSASGASFWRRSAKPCYS